MSTLQVHITAGPQAGARLQLNQSPVGFGRSAENALVLDIPVVSRQHGELTLDESGRWVLVNLSANVTRVGRKKVTKKPVPLTDGASITIGDTEVFRVYLTPEAAEQAPAIETDQSQQDAPQSDRAPGAGVKGRSKLWIGIAAWIGFLLIGAVFLKAGLDNQDEKTTGAGFYEPGNEIDDMNGREAGITSVRRLLDDTLPPNDPNQVRYNAHLTEARNAADAGKRGLYDAYTHYQQAMSYAEDRSSPLAANDVLKYDNILNQLSEIIYDTYILAYRRYNAGDYKTARNLLDDLRRDFYRGDHRVDDELAGHIRMLRNAAHSRAGG